MTRERPFILAGHPGIALTIHPCYYTAQGAETFPVSLPWLTSCKIADLCVVRTPRAGHHRKFTWTLWNDLNFFKNHKNTQHPSDTAQTTDSN